MVNRITLFKKVFEKGVEDTFSTPFILRTLVNRTLSFIFN
jgi:hypothetical protein